MNPTKKELNEKLDELEQIRNANENDIAGELQSIHNQDIEEDPVIEWQYEVLAFSFRETRLDEDSVWGTHFGPMATWRTDDGMVVENPSLSHIDEQTISYWAIRAKETRNPLLKARYSGLVWDLTEQVTGERPSYIFAEICCDSLIEISKSDYHKYEFDVIQKLKYALSLALSLRNPDLTDRVKNAILEYEEKVSDISKPGLWGFSFDTLVGNSKVDLSQEKEAEILSDLENKLDKLSESDPWKCEKAAERLISYYNTKGDQEEIHRVIKILGSSFEEHAKSQEPLVASAVYNHIHQIYAQFGLSADAKRVEIALRELGPKVINGMKEVTHRFDIPREEIEDYLAAIVDDDLDQVLKQIAFRFVPLKDKVQNQLNDLVDRAPLTFQIGRQITDFDGRVIAVVGPIDEDIDGNIVNLMSQNMIFSQFFLSLVFDRVRENYDFNSDILLDYLIECPIIAKRQHIFLSKGLQAYFNEEYISSLHILIPQIEIMIRNLIDLIGGSILKRRYDGGFLYTSLGEMLRNNQFVSSVGDDIAFYLRVVLTDHRGWNLRNNICHGLSRPETFSKSTVERIIQIIILLGQLRIIET